MYDLSPQNADFIIKSQKAVLEFSESIEFERECEQAGKWYCIQEE